MSNFNRLLLAIILAFPSRVFADINTVYDAKLKANEVKDAVVNSPIYGIVFYSGSAIVIFIVVLVVVFVLIMLLKR